MLALTSEKSGFAPSMLTEKFPTIVVDIETLDSKPLRLWNEPIISFSVSLPNNSIEDWDAPTVCFICEQKTEESKLLELLRKFLRINEESVLAGHNISHQFKNRLPWKDGYDLPKIRRRGSLHGLDFSFLENVQVFDSMDEAFENYDHSTHNRQFNGEKQRVLQCEHIEADFNIQRPEWLPKMGSKVRDYYLQYLESGEFDLLKKIILYNACDTIIESTIAKIFLHCLDGSCSDSKLISPVKRCVHIPERFPIESHPTWRRLKTADVIKISL